MNQMAQMQYNHGGASGRAISHPPGTSIPFRMDVEPPPVYVKPPPADPHVITEQIEVLNVEVKSETDHRPQPLALMNPNNGGIPSRTLDANPGTVMIPGSGEMVMTRTPRTTTWQEALNQVKHINRQSGPLSGDRYKVVSTWRDTINAEYRPQVPGQRPPQPHVYVVHNGSLGGHYKQHLYGASNNSAQFLWRKIEDQARRY